MMEVSFVCQHRSRLTLMGGKQSNEIQVPDKRSGIPPNTFVVVGEKSGEYQTKGPKLIFRRCRPLWPEELKEWPFDCWEGVSKDADVEFLGLAGKEARIRITFKVGTRSSFQNFDMKSESVETTLPPEVVKELNVENPGLTHHRVQLNQEWKGFRRGKKSWEDILMISVRVSDDRRSQWEEFAKPFLQVAQEEAEQRQREAQEKRATAVAHFFEDHPELLPVGVELTWDVMFDIAIAAGVAAHRSRPGCWGGKKEDTWREGSEWYVVEIRGEEFTRS